MTTASDVDIVAGARWRRWLALTTVLGAAALRFLVTRSRPDDAFILLVYVRHLARDGAFYYNRQDGAVDGFTSPLDLFLKAALVRVLGADPIAVTWWVSLILHMAVALFGFLLADRLARRYQIRSRLALATASGLVFGTAQALGEGSSFLLETPLVVLLGLVAVAIALFAPPVSTRARVAFGVMLIAVVLARPEGLPLAMFLLAVLFYQRPNLLSPLVFGVGVSAYYLWRLRVFGYLAPNTYYAKTSAVRLNEIRDGVAYVVEFAMARGGPAAAWLLAAPVFFAVGTFLDDRLRRGFFVAIFLAFAMVGVVIYSGGDSYHGGRLLALPLALSTIGLVIAAVGLTGLSALAARAALFGLVAIQLLVIVAIPVYRFGISGEPPSPLPSGESAFACDRDSAKAIASLLEDQPSAIVGQTDFQRLKYFADDLRVRDLSGLNDREIAHVRVDGPVRWGKVDLVAAAGQQPEMLVVGIQSIVQSRSMAEFALTDVLRKPALSDEFIGNDVGPEAAAALEKAYTTGSVRACGGYFNLLVRRDLASHLMERGAIIH